MYVVRGFDFQQKIYQIIMQLVLSRACVTLINNKQKAGLSCYRDDPLFAKFFLSVSSL